MDPLLHGIVIGALYTVLGLLLVDDADYHMGIPKALLGTVTFWITWLAWPAVLLALYVNWRSRHIVEWWHERGSMRGRRAGLELRRRLARQYRQQRGRVA